MKMRGWPYWKTSSTALSETTAPKATNQLAIGRPATSSARASGSAALSCAYGTSPVATMPTMT